MQTFMTVTEYKVKNLAKYLVDNGNLILKVTNYFTHAFVLYKDNEPYINIRYFSDESNKIEIHSKGFKITESGIQLFNGTEYIDFDISYIIEEYNNDKLFSIMTIYTCVYLREFLEQYDLHEVVEFLKIKKTKISI